jgi:hypothetical protein
MEEAGIVANPRQMKKPMAILSELSGWVRKPSVGAKRGDAVRIRHLPIFTFFSYRRNTPVTSS